MTGYDIAVLGGGLVGAAIAWGLARGGARVALLDEGDVAFRASRGNFGLVWVQSKGQGMPAYAGWTKRSSDAWAELNAALREETGVDAGFARPGGLSLCLSDTELEARVAWLRRLHNQPDMVPYPYEVLDNRGLRDVLPAVGPDVVGGVWCPIDGHANPLRLLRALHTALARRGAAYLPNHGVDRIEPGFTVHTAQGPIAAGKIVLAAGLGNARLAPMVGLTAPVRPQRGQVIVTERARPFLPHPVVTVRQTDEGSVMIGDSQEEAGFDAAVGLPVLATMAERAVRMFPCLGNLRIVRSWGALRVMTRDGFPIYQQSDSHPGAFLATCHSGVTLAAAHALLLPPLILSGALPAEMAAFHPRRFDVPAAA